MNTPKEEQGFDDLQKLKFSTPPMERDLTLAIAGNMAENGRLFCILSFILAIVVWQHVGSTGRLLVIPAAMEVLAVAAAMFGDGAQLGGNRPRLMLLSRAAHWLGGLGLAFTLLLAVVLS